MAILGRRFRERDFRILSFETRVAQTSLLAMPEIELCVIPWVQYRKATLIRNNNKQRGLNTFGLCVILFLLVLARFHSAYRRGLRVILFRVFSTKSILQLARRLQKKPLRYFVPPF